jgi:hypothetical protein
MPSETTVLALLIVGIVAVAWIGAAFARHHTGHGGRPSRHRRHDAWMDRLFDKFENPDRLIAFLESPTGREFLDTVRSGRAGIRRHVLGMLQTGILLGSLAVAFSLMRGLGSLGNDARFPLTALSILCASLSIGFITSGALAFVMARAWGLTKSQGRDVSDQ